MVEDEGVSIKDVRNRVPYCAVYYFEILNGKYELKEILSEGSSYKIFDYTLKSGYQENQELVNYLINQYGFENDNSYSKLETDWGYKYYLKNDNFEVHINKDEYIRIKKIK